MELKGSRNVNHTRFIILPMFINPNLPSSCTTPKFSNRKRKLNEFKKNFAHKKTEIDKDVPEKCDIACVFFKQKCTTESIYRTRGFLIGTCLSQ